MVYFSWLSRETLSHDRVSRFLVKQDMKARKLTIMKTYKFKMYSNHGNRELHKTIDGHASVWNHSVALQRRYYAIYGKYISKFRLINHISNLKQLPRFAHWNQLPSQAIQDVAARIDKGYKAMFESRARGKPWGRPRFKPRRKYKSFTLLQAGWKLLPGNRIKMVNISISISSPVILKAPQNVAQLSGTPSVTSISVC